MKKILTFVLMLLLQTSIYAGWESINNNLWGGSVKCILPTPQGIFAGVENGGVYVSLDSGMTWAQRNDGLTDLNVNCIVKMNKLLYAGTNSGIFISDNDGKNWKVSENAIEGVQVNCLAVKNDTLIAGTERNIYFSFDYGDSWEISTCDSLNYSIFSLAVNDSVIFAGTENGLLISIDNGATWKREKYSSYGPAYSIYSALIVDTTIYVGFNGWVIARGINEDKWTDLNNGLRGKSVVSLFYKNGSLYAGTMTWDSSGVYKLDSKDGEWELLYRGLTKLDGYCSVQCLAGYGDKIIAGTDGGGVFVTDDSGKNWEKSNKGINACIVTDFAEKNGILYASCYTSGLFKSSNGGGSWEYLDNFPGEEDIDGIAVSKGNIVVNSGSGVFASTDDGKTWIAVNNGNNDISSYSFFCNDSAIYSGFWKEFWKSTDGGINWEQKSTGLIGINYYILAVKNKIFGSGTRGLIVSTDDGCTWKNVSMLNQSQSSSIIISNNIIYAAFYGAGLYISSDYGTTWIDIGSNLTDKVLDFVTVKDNYIFAGTYTHGLYLSTDMGVGWTSINSGLPSDHMRVRKFKIIDSTIYAGFYSGGAYKAKISDFTMTGINEQTAENDFSIYTDHSYNTLHINGITGEKAEIYDIFGRKISENVFSPNMDINELNNGIYFLLIKSGKRTYTKKFIICR